MQNSLVVAAAVAVALHAGLANAACAFLETGAGQAHVAVAVPDPEADVAAHASILARRVQAYHSEGGSVLRQMGADQILAQVPDTVSADLALFRRGQFSIHHVIDEGDGVTSAGPGQIVANGRDHGRKYLLDAAPAVINAGIADASLAIGPTGAPIVNIRLDRSSKRAFGEFTAAHVGERIAIVLDHEVLTTPVVQTPILGGAASIDGGFTIETAKVAAILIGSTPLPDDVKPLELRLVGPLPRNRAVTGPAVLIELDTGLRLLAPEICDRLAAIAPRDISVQYTGPVLPDWFIWVEFSDRGAPDRIGQAVAEAFRDTAEIRAVRTVGPDLLAQ